MVRYNPVLPGPPINNSKSLEQQATINTIYALPVTTKACASRSGPRSPSHTFMSESVHLLVDLSHGASDGAAEKTKGEGFIDMAKLGIP